MSKSRTNVITGEIFLSNPDVSDSSGYNIANNMCSAMIDLYGDNLRIIHRLKDSITYSELVVSARGLFFNGNKIA